MMRKYILLASSFLLVPSLFAERSAPWTKARAWEWYDSQPWIRGCNYMPASAVNRVDQWQELGSEARFQEVERDLALAESIGFNTLRILVEEQGFGGWLADHEWFSPARTKRWAAKCRHPLWVAQGELAKKVGGHGGMDFLMILRLCECLCNGEPLDMDVYDLVTTCCICELSEKSVRHKSRPQDIPDFTINRKEGRYKS